jgi:uncharacterized secreted protein with C-terminal beta-propeller domain
MNRLRVMLFMLCCLVAVLGGVPGDMRAVTGTAAQTESAPESNPRAQAENEADLAGSAAATDIAVSYNGIVLTFNNPPFLLNSRLMLPLRDIAASLGAEVHWDRQTQTATVTRRDDTVALKVGKRTAVMNGQALMLDEPPVMVGGVVFVPARSFVEAMGAIVSWNDGGRTVAIADGTTLPAVGSEQNLRKLLAESATKFSPGANVDFDFSTSGIAATDVVRKSAAANAGVGLTAQTAAVPDYSATNTQVQGVDEADIVKTDGTYIYQVNGRQVIISKVYPAVEMETVGTLEFDQRFYPRELYVDGDILVVIGSATFPYPTDKPQAEFPVEAAPKKRAVVEPDAVSPTVRAIIYDIADKSNIVKKREVELEGSYVSSRKIGSALYLVANRSVRFVHGTMTENGASPQSAAPLYRDSIAGDEPMHIGFDRIYYFPETVLNRYLTIGGLDLDAADRPLNVAAYLGSGQQVYVSEKNLYVAFTHYGYKDEPAPTKPTPLPQDMPLQSLGSSIAVPPSGGESGITPAAGRSETLVESAPVRKIADPSTRIYRFKLDRGNATFAAEGTVPGTILNQFSMDEFDGFFRIATTTRKFRGASAPLSENNLYILDETLQQTGKIEGLAPEEKIYSVRFAGKRGYVVTFRTVDPLFVIDLDPHEPRVLGALKIPGYSNYLHPVDENHIIGFGKSTIELPGKSAEAGLAATTVYELGMKMALFDVTDVAHPIELFKEEIGDRGTDSELLYNHKALLFSREKNLIAFPVTVREVRDANANGKSVPQYGELTFQGAFVYSLDLSQGFRLKGKITHLSDGDMLKSGYATYDRNKQIERILYIDNYLYTVSRAMIKANELDTLRELNSLTLTK